MPTARRPSLRPRQLQLRLPRHRRDRRRQHHPTILRRPRPPTNRRRVHIRLHSDCNVTAWSPASSSTLSAHSSVPLPPSTVTSHPQLVRSFTDKPTNDIRQASVSAASVPVATVRHHLRPLHHPRRRRHPMHILPPINLQEEEAAVVRFSWPGTLTKLQKLEC